MRTENENKTVLDNKQDTVLSESSTANETKELSKRPNDLYRFVKDSLVDLAKSTENAKASEQVKAYLRFVARFHKYSWNNSFLILAQNPNATKVRGMKQWNKDFSRFVKASVQCSKCRTYFTNKELEQQTGQEAWKAKTCPICKERLRRTAIAILAPSPYKIKVKVPKLDEQGQPKANEQGETELEEIEETRQGFITVYVYDVEDTQGKPIPRLDLTVSDSKSILDRLLAIAEKRGLTVEQEDMRSGQYGYVTGQKKIALRQDMNEASKSNVLIHELAHWDLDHLGDMLASRSRHETEAEAVCYAVASYFGLETKSDLYLSIWSKDTRQILEAFERIKDTTAKLIREIEEAKPTQTAVVQTRGTDL